MLFILKKPEFTALLALAYLLAVVVLALLVPGWVNGVIALFHLGVFYFLEPKKRQKIGKFFKSNLSLFLIIILASGLLSPGRTELFRIELLGILIRLTLEGLMAGLQVVFLFLAIASAALLLQLKPVNRAVLAVAKKYRWLFPVYTAYELFFSGQRQQFDWKRLDIGTWLEDGSLNIKKAYRDHRKEPPSQATAYMTAAVVMLLSLKVLRLIPGLPLAPGHKLVVLVPVLYMVSVKHKFGAATITATLYAVATLLIGQVGQLLLFEFFRLVLVGLMVDLSGLVIKGTRGFKRAGLLLLFGIIIGVLFTSFSLFLASLLKVPALVFVFGANRFLGGVVFGAASGIIAGRALSRS